MGPDDAGFQYGEMIAKVYDEWESDFGGDAAAAVDFLHHLVTDGRALELGIGTGRIGLPLAARGVRVAGIEISPGMVEQLRAKPGSEAIDVTIGDMVDVHGGPFELIFAVYNTMMFICSQEDQVRCFQNVAQNLAPTGVFVVENWIPSEPEALRTGQRTRTTVLPRGRVLLEAEDWDQTLQHIHRRDVLISAAGIEVYPIETRYIWPSELDLMARIAGMRLRERWGGWRNEPYTSASRNHVSVYEWDSAKASTGTGL